MSDVPTFLYKYKKIDEHTLKALSDGTMYFASRKQGSLYCADKCNGKRNMCDSAPNDAEVAAQVAVTRYENCEKGATVALYSVREAGHIWPGGMKFPGNFAGPNSDSINATHEMWQFFKNHPLTP